MIEETGRVLRAQAGLAWVETMPRSGCDGCSARGGCGTPVLASLFGRRAAPLRVADPLGVHAGDRVVIGIAESGLVRGSLAVYLAPLAGLLLGAVGGQWLAGPGAYSEAGGISGALAGLLAGLAWVRRFSRRTAGDGRFQPVLLRRLPASNDETGMTPARDNHGYTI